MSAALRGRAAVRALGLGLAAAAEGVAGGIGTGCTAGVGVWSRIGARAVDADERKRGEGRWRSAAAHPGHEGVGGYARRDEVDLNTVRSMLVDARRDMTVWARVRSGSELLADGTPAAALNGASKGSRPIGWHSRCMAIRRKRARDIHTSMGCT